MTKIFYLFVFYLTTLLVSYSVKWQGDNNNETTMNESGRSQLSGGTEENNKKSSVSIACPRAEIWTRDLPNTKQPC